MDSLWVLDTSVAVRWFFRNEPLAEPSLSIRDSVRDEPDRFFVPPLFLSELVHVLVRKTRGDKGLVEEIINNVINLGIRTVQLSRVSAIRTVHWACLGLGGYDATFVALAEELGARWLTADERALKIAGAKYGRSLAEWSDC